MIFWSNWHCGPENLKKSRPKKLVKSNKSISRNFFDQIQFFAISKMAKNHFLNWEKNPPEMQFHKKFLVIFFFAWTFLNFPARCERRKFNSWHVKYENTFWIKIEEREKKQQQQFSVKYYWGKNVQKILREYVCIAMREVL